MCRSLAAYRHQVLTALAVDTLSLVLANDDVLQCRASLKDEHGVLVTALLLASARLATVDLGPATYPTTA